MASPTVDLWHVDLDTVSHHDPAVASAATDEDRARAQRFRSSLDRDRFVLRCAFVRSVLGRYLGREPRSVGIERPIGGKPRSRDDPRLHFNLSASGPTAVLAVADEEIGVDVETIRGDADTENITQRWFAPAERAAIDGLDGMDLVNAVFDILTRKEAALKAAGVGLAVSPSLVDVITPGRVVVPSVPATTWYLQSLSLHPAVAVALAARERDRRVVLHAWDAA